MTERRYSDEEVARIFEQATESTSPTPHRSSGSAGLSLVELQEIGDQVGIPADRVISAARAIDLAPATQDQTFLRVPIGVGEVVELNRRLSNDEWNQLVVAAREEFGARGTLREDGDFKQWTNGNLQVLLEPTARGNRVRFSSKSDATQSGLVGTAVSIGIAGLMIVGPLIGGAGGMAGVYTGAGFVLTASLGIFGITVGRARSWAKLRRQQMQRLAHRLESPDSHGPQS